MVKNTMGIGKIIYKEKLKCFCPLGGEYCTNNLTIEFTPDEDIPDYVKLSSGIQSMQGSELIIEEVVDKVMEIIKSFNPLNAKVSSHVTDANHPEVTVIKEYSKSYY